LKELKLPCPVNEQSSTHPLCSPEESGLHHDCYLVENYCETLGLVEVQSPSPWQQPRELQQEWLAQQSDCGVSSYEHAVLLHPVAVVG